LGLSFVDGDMRVVGRLMCGSFDAPANSVSDASIEALAGIQATKVVQQFSHYYDQVAGTAIVAATKTIHIARAAGTIVSLEGVITGTVTAGDYTATVDLKKSTAGGAFASVLSAPLVFDSGNTVRVLEAASINISSYIDGDLLQITVAVAGTTGSQSQGLTLVLTLRENPE
jgi:hypothetical protein